MKLHAISPVFQPRSVDLYCNTCNGLLDVMGRSETFGLVVLCKETYCPASCVESFLPAFHATINGRKHPIHFRQLVGFFGFDPVEFNELMSAKKKEN